MPAAMVVAVVIVAMVVMSVVIVIMLIGLDVLGRLGVGLGQGFALGLLVGFHVALLVFLVGTAGTIVVAPGLDAGLPILIRHKASSMPFLTQAL
jgi:hypothetical protein